MTFESLGLAEPILAGVRAAGYDTPTDIQKQAIPIVLAGRDLIALGQTGSGKTAAFGLPMLHKLVGGPRGLRAFILVPTRELCVQVAENLRQYASHSEIAVCTAFGGVALSIQESAFKRGLDLLVACPGRLIDHLERGNVDMRDVGTIVLDEADRMLDMGFLPQIRSILVRCPQERQTLLFSATMPPEVEDLCKNFIPHAERVQVGLRSQAAASISHRFVAIDNAEKDSFLEKLLRRETGRVLIFVNTKIRADRLGRRLAQAGLPADSIHGDKDAEARHTILRAFERGRVRFLVATDVAARGIDVDDITLVLNWELPRGVEDYVHRVGRTGRAGALGRALSLVGSAERRQHKAVVEHLRKTSGKGSAGDGAEAGKGERRLARPSARGR